MTRVYISMPVRSGARVESGDTLTLEMSLEDAVALGVQLAEKINKAVSESTVKVEVGS